MNWVFHRKLYFLGGGLWHTDYVGYLKNKLKKQQQPKYNSSLVKAFTWTNMKPWGPSRQHTLPRWQPTVAARVANPATVQVGNNLVPLLNRYLHLHHTLQFIAQWLTLQFTGVNCSSSRLPAIHMRAKANISFPICFVGLLCHHETVLSSGTATARQWTKYNDHNEFLLIWCDMWSDDRRIWVSKIDNVPQRHACVHRLS